MKNSRRFRYNWSVYRGPSFTPTIFTCFFSAFFFAAVSLAPAVSWSEEAYGCLDQEPPPDQLENLNADRCAVLDALENSCALKNQKTDNADARKRWLGYLDRLESEPKLPDTYGYRGALSVFADIPPGSPAHQALQEKLVDDMLKYRHEFHCTKGVQVRLDGIYLAKPFFEKGMNDFSGKSINNEKNDFLKTPAGDVKRAESEKWVREMADARSGTPEKQVGNLTVCSPPRQDPEPRVDAERRFPNCGANLMMEHADNQVDFRPGSWKEDPNLKSCIEGMKALGAEIDKIQIDSSSSLLSNTGDAGKTFCKKGFKALSEARAQSAKENVLPVLLQGYPGSEGKISTARVNSDGTNKDGTSGACPYEIVNGKEQLKPGYRTDLEKKKLDSAKYVKVNISFKPKTEKIPVANKVYSYRSYCKAVRYSCKE